MVVENIYKEKNMLRLINLDEECTFGKYIIETKKSQTGSLFITENDSGVYIYQTYYDKNKALRIYKSDIDTEKELRMLVELNKKQENIYLTDFPTGVVTFNNKIIGQEIPYYDNALTLFQYLRKMQNKADWDAIFTNIFEILEELINNGIDYCDIHLNNFMILATGEIKLIDFASSKVAFDNENMELKKYMFVNLKDMILFLGYRLNCETITKRLLENMLERFDDYLSNVYVDKKKINKKLVGLTMYF